MELKNYIGEGLLIIYMNSIYVIIYHAGIEKLPTMAILLCFAEHENHKQSVTQTKTKKNKQTNTLDTPYRDMCFQGMVTGTKCVFGSALNRINCDWIDSDRIDSERIDFETINLCLDTII